MAKKKIETVKSVALFDEEPPVKKAPVQTKKKETKKKKNETSNSSTDNTNSVVNNRQCVHKKATEEVENPAGRKRQNTSSANEKSRPSSKTNNKNTRRTSADKKLNKRSTKSDKNNSSKGTARGTKKESGTSRSTTSNVNEQRKIVDRSVSSSKKAVEEKPRGSTETPDIFKEAKKRKHKWTRGSEIMPPKQITGKPKVLSDDLVAVIIDGEYYEVSPWSIRDGMYCQGFDSHYLVNYLYYKPVSTKYDEIDAQFNIIEETKKQKKK